MTDPDDRWAGGDGGNREPADEEEDASHHGRAVERPVADGGAAPGAVRRRYGGIPLWNRLDYPTRDRVKRAWFYVLLAIVVGFVIFPIFWMFSTAMRPPQDVFTRSLQLLPPRLSLDHYDTVIFNSKFLRYYLNSLIVSAGVVSLTTVMATLGGYGLTRIDIPHKETFAMVILVGYMFPPILLGIPMYIFWAELGILNSYVGLILAETAIALPFSLWLMWKFFQTVPLSLEESAYAAGASRFRAFVDIALPMSVPGIIAVAIFSYAVSWNAFTIPLIIMSDPNLWPLTVGVFTFVVQNMIQWGAIMAASSMIVLPALLFTYFLQRYLLRGFRAGGIG